MPPKCAVYFTTIKSCEVLDPYTVRFTATESYFKTLELLGTYIVVVPKHVFEKGDPDFNKERLWPASNRHRPLQIRPLGYRLQIVFERNDDYWDTVHPRYPKRHHL